jgi:hypothetical protein
MKKTWVSLVVIAASVLGAAVTSRVPAAATPAVVVLDDQAKQLRADFNAEKGSVRHLLIVDPACSVCLRGLDDVNAALLAKVDDPRLQTFVVHTSVIGAEQKHVAPAAELLTNAHVRHYWDPSGNVGRAISDSMQLRRGDEVVYAWDVWMIYDHAALMRDSRMPVPVLFMHQLPKLRDQADKPFLDADVFASKAMSLLAALPGANIGSADR